MRESEAIDSTAVCVGWGATNSTMGCRTSGRTKTSWGFTSTVAQHNKTDCCHQAAPVLSVAGAVLSSVLPLSSGTCLPLPSGLQVLYRAHSGMCRAMTWPYTELIAVPVLWRAVGVRFCKAASLVLHAGAIQNGRWRMQRATTRPWWGMSPSPSD